MKIFNRILAIFVLFCFSFGAAYADGESARADFSFTIPRYTSITPVTSPVLIANITDRTGNLHSPLYTRFRVITNSHENKNLYLKANVVTEGGMENAMFEQGGQVYIAFANLARIPSSSSLYNCKMGAMPADSPGVVAYPVTSIQGTEKARYMKGKDKYEVEVKGGETYVTVNVGQNVLRSSFAGNDPKGFYQAILSLTEADI